jgi:hypothetical protein
MVCKAIREVKLTFIVMTLLFAGGFLAAGCSSDKGQKSEKAGETQKVETEVKTEVKTQEAPTSPTPGPKSEFQHPSMTSHGPPPEITEPCKGLNVGDDCTVVLTGGREIPGRCVMSRTQILACMPKPRVSKPVHSGPPQQKQSE